MAFTSINSLGGCIIAPHAGVHMISINRYFHITSTTFIEFWLYELEPYIVRIEHISVKCVQKIIYFNRMHVVYLSQQSRLTLVNMVTQFIRKFYIGFHLTQRCAVSKFNKWKSFIFPLLLPKDVHSRNSTNENHCFFPNSKWFLPNCPLLATWVWLCV